MWKTNYKISCMCTFKEINNKGDKVNETRTVIIKSIMLHFIKSRPMHRVVARSFFFSVDNGDRRRWTDQWQCSWWTCWTGGKTGISRCHTERLFFHLHRIELCTWRLDIYLSNGRTNIVLRSGSRDLSQFNVGQTPTMTTLESCLYLSGLGSSISSRQMFFWILSGFPW